MSDEGVQLELSINEAIVLSEFVDRYTQTDQLTIVDQAEQRVLWNICCELEKVLTAPIKTNYREILEKARSDVRD